MNHFFSRSMFFLLAFMAGVLMLAWVGMAVASPAKDTPEGVVPPGYEDVIEGAVQIQPHFPGVTVGILAKGKKGRPHVFYFYPIIGNQVVSKIIHDRITRDAKEFFGEVAKNEGNEALAEWLNNWNRYSNYKISRPSDNVISIVLGFGGYQGGNGPWYYHESLHFLLPEGKRLGFNDLFDDPQMALELMSAWSRKHIERQLIKEGTPPGEIQRERFAEGTAPRRENFSTLMLGPDGIYINFGYYQVKVGVNPDTYMPLRELKKAGPKAQIWGR